jgi:GTPase
MANSLATLRLMASELKATTSILRRKNLDSGKSCVEVLVRKLSENKNIEEIRISVMGSVDAGKSSIISVLTQGELDNGRGRARLQMFRHFHEIKSGRTSCISHELLGFDQFGNVISKHNEMMTAEEVSDLSTKLISFMDLAGHRRYMRTTIQAVSGYAPHFIALVIASGNLNQMTIENLQIIKAFKIPFFVILTKIDLVSPEDAGTLKQLLQLLNDVDKLKTPLIIGSMNDFRLLDEEDSKKYIPIFCVSNVTGAGLDFLQKYLFMLTPNINEGEQHRLDKEPPEFHIDEIFRVQGVGTIVGGLLVKGTMYEKMKVKCGPGPNGEFYQGFVKSIHRNKFPCKSIKSNQCASVCFSVSNELPVLRSGMVLVADNDDTQACVFFQVNSTKFVLFDFLTYCFIYLTGNNCRYPTPQHKRN